MIRDVTPRDARALCRIYNPYILQTTITFEEYPVLPQDMEERIQAILAQQLPWLVWEDGDEILGYAYARPWQTRSAYRFTLESSIYTAQEARGRGIGRKLYQALLDRLQQRQIHAVVACIALPNPSSIVLHQKLGFERVGRFPEVGRKFNQWVDVEYWQRRLYNPAFERSAAEAWGQDPDTYRASRIALPTLPLPSELSMIPNAPTPEGG
ncbi:MAG: GNAT family N-acetyltransferase [Prochlorothrix sp.]|nr:GNAT family N-acetyltransferase [Prochlorothrix sp.]